MLIPYEILGNSRFFVNLILGVYNIYIRDFPDPPRSGSKKEVTVRARSRTYIKVILRQAQEVSYYCSSKVENKH